MSLTQDKEFIERLCRQDRAAFVELVRFYHRQMIVVARGIVGEAQAEEVVQDAWIAAYRNLPGFEKRSSVTTWIYTIVSNAARTRLRRDIRMVQLDAGVEADTGMPAERFNADGSWSTPPPQWDVDSPEQLLEEEQLKDCIEKTTEALPNQQRMVFTLREIEQQSPEQVCNILGISDSNLRVLLHRARMKLMQVIDRYQETGQC